MMLFNNVKQDNNKDNEINIEKKTSLKQLIKPIKLNQALKIITKICKKIFELHKNNQFNEKLSSENIIINEINKDIIINLNLKNIDDNDQEKVIYSMLYLSPEQTGFINTEVSKQSNIYSIGIIFYELLTGETPFIDNNIKKIVYKHLTEEPVKPSLKNENIPDIIDEIIIKCLQKNPVDRFEDILELQNILEYISTLSNKNLYSIKLDEIKSIYIKSHTKMISRNSEVEYLKDKYNELDSGNPRIVMIKGISGIGKSELVEAFKNNILNDSDPIFLSFKCSVSTQNMPFIPIINFINRYFENIPESKITEILERLNKKNILSKLVQFVPNIKKYLSNISFDEKKSKKNEFNQGFLIHGNNEIKNQKLLYIVNEFFCEIGSQERNLLLFIDDIQWIDEDSLTQILYFYKNMHNCKIMIILNSSNDLKIDMQTSDIFSTIQLKPLNQYDVKILINNYLKIKEDENFKDIFYERILDCSNGIPFYIFETIKALLDSKVVSKKSDEWVVDYKKLEDFKLKNDLSYFLTRRLNRLEKEERMVLAIAAMIGKEFRFDFLIKILDIFIFQVNKSDFIQKIKRIIKKAKQEQILKENEKGLYGFCHDKIKEILYENLTVEFKNRGHLFIAQILEEIYQENIDKSVFCIAYHYNNTNKEEKKIKYNFLAYQKAKEIFSLNETVFYLKKIIESYFINNNLNEEIVNLIIELSVFLQIIGRVKESFYYLEKALVISRKNKWIKSEFNILITIGRGKGLVKKLGESKENFKLAIKICEKYKEEKEINIKFAYYCMGVTTYFSSNFKKSKYYLDKTLENVNESDEIGFLLMIYAFKLLNEAGLGNYVEAKSYLNKIEANINKIESPILLAKLYSFCSLYYAITRENPERALEYITKSEVINNRSNSIYNQSINIPFKMRVLLTLGKNEEVIKIGEKALKDSSKNNVFIGIDHIYMFMVDAYLNLGNFKKANDMAIKFSSDKYDIEFEFCKIILIKARLIYSYLNRNKEKCLTLINEGYNLYKKIGCDHVGIFFILFKIKIYKEIMDFENVEKLNCDLLEILKNKQLNTVYSYYTKFLEMIEDFKEKEKSNLTISKIKEEIQINTVVKVSQLISEISDLEKLLDYIMVSTGAERAFVCCYHNRNNEFDCREKKNISNQEITFIKNILTETVNKKEVVIINDLENNNTYEFLQKNSNNKIKSLISLPILFRGEIIGVLYLDSCLLTNLFCESDLEIFKVFAAQMAIYLKDYKTEKSITTTNVNINNEKLNQYCEDKKITKREKEILLLLMKRFQNPEISNTLSISLNTVKMHIQNIFKKINVKKRREFYELIKEII